MISVPLDRSFPISLDLTGFWPVSPHRALYADNKRHTFEAFPASKAPINGTINWFINLTFPLFCFNFPFPCNAGVLPKCSLNIVCRDVDREREKKSSEHQATLPGDDSSTAGGDHFVSMFELQRVLIAIANLIRSHFAVNFDIVKSNGPIPF